MKKAGKIAVGLLLVLVIALGSTPVTAASQSEIRVTIDGQRLNFPTQGPVIVGGRTLVPLRAVFEALGFTVTWQPDTRTATLTRGNDIIVIAIGRSSFTANGERHTLDVPAQIINNYTMLPIRAVLESVGYNLVWIGEENTAAIFSATYGWGGWTFVAGDWASYAIDPDGILWAWGDNEDGQLGDGTTRSRTRPVRIKDDVVYVAAGPSYAMAITTDGSLWGWGHPFALGLGNVGNEIVTTPTLIMEDVASVSAGRSQAAAIKTDGSLWAWGNGPVGDGSDTLRRRPVHIMDDAIYIHAACASMVAITSDGTLWGWGRFELTEDGRDIPTSGHLYPVVIMENVVHTVSGHGKGMAIQADGRVWSWGGTSPGGAELINTTHTTAARALPLMGNGRSVHFGGYDQRMVLDRDGNLWAWGGGDTIARTDPHCGFV